MLKRSFDFSLALAGLFIFSPFIVLICLLLLFEEGRPVFYRKISLGKDGKEFGAIKFRSMNIDSPEITRLGLTLRKTAMDELPQLVNILKGEMSFVGPRNYGADKYKTADANFLKRLKITPGLTGLAQIFAPKCATNDEILKWDLEYMAKRNFILDLKIIFISIWITLRGRWENRNRKI